MIIRSPIMAGWAILRISTQEWAWTLSTALAAVILFTIIGVKHVFCDPKIQIAPTIYR